VDQGHSEVTKMTIHSVPLMAISYLLVTGINQKQVSILFAPKLSHLDLSNNFQSFLNIAISSDLKKLGLKNNCFRKLTISQLIQSLL
jgi:hypothetical protein